MRGWGARQNTNLQLARDRSADQPFEIRNTLRICRLVRPSNPAHAQLLTDVVLLKCAMYCGLSFGHSASRSKIWPRPMRRFPASPNGSQSRPARDAYLVRTGAARARFSRHPQMRNMFRI